MNSRIARSSRAVALCTGFLVTGFGMAQNATLATPHPSWTALNPVTRLTPATFAHPPAADRPWVRVNTPAELSSEELRAEVMEMHQHGIGGLELGQGTFPKTPQLVALLKTANEVGLKVSLSHGSTVTPNGYSYNEANVRKTLLFTASKVNAGAQTEITFTAPLPPANARGRQAPAAPPAPRRSGLIAVLAYRCAQSACEATGLIELDPASVVDLTATVTGKNTNGLAGASSTGQLKWTAPAGGQWQVIALWSQGVFVQPDLYSKEGTDDLIHGMEADWTPEVKALLKANGGDIFYDSHSSDRGSPTELWTNNMEAEFKARRGYSLIQNGAALFEKNFSFSDGSASRVRNDLNAVRGDLWVEKHLKPMASWVHTFNFRLRLQPYGEATTTSPDEIQAATVVDRPETESLFFGDEIDSFLPIASANHMTGNTWYSTECCAALNKSYAQTFQDAVIRMHREYAAGVTKLIYHVYPYRDSVDNKWPGYHSFGQAGFSNAWGPRNPFWLDAPTYNDYLSRTQQVLTQGNAKVDVAVYMQSYLFPQPMFVKGGFHIWPDTKLQEAGFTRDYLDPTLLAMPNATVTAGRLAMDKAAYKALIIDREQQPAADPIKSSMPLDTARKILALAKAGLPIVVVGAPPDQTPGRTPKDDAALQALMAELTSIKNVHTVAHEGDVPALLLSLGIHPAAEPVSPSPLRSLHRQDTAKATDFYFFYNESVVSPKDEPTNLFEQGQGKPFDGELHLQGHGKPYLMDAWTGKITPLKDYTTANGVVTLHMTITPDDVAMIALSPTPLGTTATPAKVTAASASPIDLTNAKWHLSVEDWKPTQPYGATGVQAAETTKSTVQVDIDALKPWPQIAAIKDASGVGTYSTSLDLPASWKPNTGATLSLGEVFDSFTLTINGKAVPVNQISATAEVGPYLHAGVNSIQVRVATTLNNRLAGLDPDVKKRGLVQPYGLIGPVVLTPNR
jgi:hypothetical protein